MAKELPYFKFEPSEYIAKDVQDCTLEAQGAFINICAYYWLRLGDMKYTTALKRVVKNGGEEQLLLELIEMEVVKVEENKIRIGFLDNQLNDFKSQSEQNSQNALKGWGNKPERITGNQVYILRCWDKSEEFIKIGSTTTSINRRYSGKMPYKFEALVIELESDSGVNHVDLEIIYNDFANANANNYEYIPKKEFHGKNECFRIHIKGDLLEFAKRRNAKYVRSNAIREEKKREEKKREEKKADLPWPTKKFEGIWAEWKNYKKEQFNFRYKSASTEQAALTELNKLASDENVAIEIINQSIANGWKGFFELKQNGGKQNGFVQEVGNHLATNDPDWKKY